MAGRKQKAGPSEHSKLTLCSTFRLDQVKDAFFDQICNISGWTCAWPRGIAAFGSTCHKPVPWPSARTNGREISVSCCVWFDSAGKAFLQNLNCIFTVSPPLVRHLLSCAWPRSTSETAFPFMVIHQIACITAGSTFSCLIFIARITHICRSAVN